MYHGTALQNIPSILSQGLVIGRDMTFDNPLTFETIRSYGGIYFSKNLMTAMSVGGTSAAKRGNRSVKGLVVAKLETTSPHITVDEDLLPRILGPVQQVTKLCVDEGSMPEYIAFHLTEGYSQTMPEMVKNYKERLAYGLNADRQFLDHLDKYIEAMLRAYMLDLLAAQMENYYRGTTAYLKREFDERYPQFAGLQVGQAEGAFREQAQVFLQKAQRLTEFGRDKAIDYKVRSTRPISFRGSNKIVGVAQWADSNDPKAKYYLTVDFNYLSDDSFMQDMIEQIRQRWSKNFLVTVKGHIYFESPRAEGEE
jgi:hypothetical protein